MFFPNNIVRQNQHLSVMWLAAIFPEKLKKKDFLRADIKCCIAALLPMIQVDVNAEFKFSIALCAQLVHGLGVIWKHKVDDLAKRLEDFSLKFQKLVTGPEIDLKKKRGKDVDLPPPLLENPIDNPDFGKPQHTVPNENITLQEVPPIRFEDPDYTGVGSSFSDHEDYDARLLAPPKDQPDQEGAKPTEPGTVPMEPGTEPPEQGTEPPEQEAVPEQAPGPDGEAGKQPEGEQLPPDATSEYEMPPDDQEKPRTPPIPKVPEFPQPVNPTGRRRPRRRVIIDSKKQIPREDISRNLKKPDICTRPSKITLLDMLPKPDELFSKPGACMTKFRKPGTYGKLLGNPILELFNKKRVVPVSDDTSESEDTEKKSPPASPQDPLEQTPSLGSFPSRHEAQPSTPDTAQPDPMGHEEHFSMSTFLIATGDEIEFDESEEEHRDEQHSERELYSEEEQPEDKIPDEEGMESGRSSAVPDTPGHSNWSGSTHYDSLKSTCLLPCEGTFDLFQEIADKKGFCYFSDLSPPEKDSREEAAITFHNVLHMHKHKLVSVTQEVEFGPILIRLLENWKINLEIARGSPSFNGKECEF